MVLGLYVADLRPWEERKNYGQITETNEGAQRLELVTIPTSIHLGFLFVCRPLFSFFLWPTSLSASTALPPPVRTCPVFLARTRQSGVTAWLESTNFEQSHPRCFYQIKKFTDVCRYTVRTQLCYIIRYYTTYQLHVSPITWPSSGCTKLTE